MSQSAGPRAAAIKVLICDDDAMVRQALGTYLASSDDVEVVAAVPDAMAAQPYLEDGTADVLLLDVRMPGMDGPELVQWMTRLPKRPRVLYLTSMTDDRMVHDTVNGQVSGALTKDVTPAALIRAIRTVHDGMTVLSGTSSAQLKNGYKPAPSAPVADLSERERHVLKLLCAGQSNHEIAQQIYLSESSVKNIIASLMQRLGAKNRVSLALRAVEAGLS